MKRACIFTSSGRYGEIIDTLCLFIDSFQVEKDVEPWMLGYRDYDLYILATDGLDLKQQARLLNHLPDIVRNHSTRVFGVWTNTTWKALKCHMPHCLGCQNIVHCDTPNWISDLTVALKSAERKRNDD